jgi:hypothetical protein
LSPEQRRACKLSCAAERFRIYFKLGDERSFTVLKTIPPHDAPQNLTITLTKPNSTVAALTAPFSDNLLTASSLPGGASTTLAERSLQMPELAGYSDGRRYSRQRLLQNHIYHRGNARLQMQVETPSFMDFLQTNEGANTVQASANITVN